MFVKSDAEQEKSLSRFNRSSPEAILWGYDISPQAIELAKNRANERLHSHLGDFSDVKNDYFELILVLDVIEHLQDYFGFLCDLKEKGRHKISHSPGSSGANSRAQTRAAQTPRHVRAFALFHEGDRPRNAPAKPGTRFWTAFTRRERIILGRRQGSGCSSCLAGCSSTFTKTWRCASWAVTASWFWPAETTPSFEQIGLGAGDALPERLELEPAGKMRAHERVRVLRGFVGNAVRLARGFREQLRLARAVHGDEPPSGFIDCVANGKQAVIAENGSFLRAKSMGDAVALRSFFDDAAVIVEHHVIFVKRAGILGERVEPAAKRRPRFAIKRMGVGSGNHVRPSGVDAGMNRKSGEIDFSMAFDDFAGVIHQNQVGGANPAEVQAKRIHPEMIEALGVACGDVAGDAFVKTEFGEEAKSASEALLAVAALFGGGRKDGRARNTLHKVTVRRLGSGR